MEQHGFIHHLTIRRSYFNSRTSRRKSSRLAERIEIAIAVNRPLARTARRTGSGGTGTVNGAFGVQSINCVGGNLPYVTAHQDRVRDVAGADYFTVGQDLFPSRNISWPKAVKAIA